MVESFWRFLELLESFMATSWSRFSTRELATFPWSQALVYSDTVYCSWLKGRCQGSKIDQSVFLDQLGGTNTDVVRPPPYRSPTSCALWGEVAYRLVVISHTNTLCWQNHDDNREKQNLKSKTWHLPIKRIKNKGRVASSCASCSMLSAHKSLCWICATTTPASWRSFSAAFIPSACGLIVRSLRFRVAFIWTSVFGMAATGWAQSG